MSHNSTQIIHKQIDSIILIKDSFTEREKKNDLNIHKKGEPSKIVGAVGEEEEWKRVVIYVRQS